MEKQLHGSTTRPHPGGRGHNQGAVVVRLELLRLMLKVWAGESVLWQRVICTKYTMDSHTKKILMKISTQSMR